MLWLLLDIAADGAYDEAIKDNSLDGIIHTASPCHLNFTDPNELLIPAIKGTEDLLASVVKLAPKVKKVVITSSIAAIINPRKGSWPGHVYSESGASIPCRWHTVTVAIDHAPCRLESCYYGRSTNRG